MLRNLLRKLPRLLLIPLVCGILGLLLLAGSFLLPAEPIWRHAADSAPILEEEGHFYSLTPTLAGTKMDNYTEALYLSQALVTTEDASLAECVLGGNEFLSAGFEGTTIQQLNQVLAHPETRELLDGSKRFFNGYTAVVKLLLTVTNYSGIRELNGFLAILLTLLMLMLMIRRGLERCVLPTVIALLMLRPLTMTLNMVFFGFYLAMILPCIVLLRLPKETLRDRGWLIFGLTGALTFYFNMNYLQLLSFCVPVLFYFLLTGIPEKPSELIRTGAELFIAWMIGWAGMMLFKWAVYIPVLGTDIIGALGDNIALRTSEVSGSRVQAVLANARLAFGHKWWLLLEAAYLLSRLIRLKPWSRKRPSAGLAPRTPALLLLLVMILFPMIRYMIFPDHVLEHDYVTYRLCMIPVLALNLLVEQRDGPRPLKKSR